MGEGRSVHRVLVGKHEVKSPLGLPRCSWKDDIKTDLQREGGGGGDWMSWLRIRKGGEYLCVR
jgi:hypothetical protein